MRIEKASKEAEHFKIYQGVFDTHTLKTLVSLASKGYFDSLDFPISTGKEADVYRATTKKGDYVALKIYRIETSNFKAMQRYLDGDPRFGKIKKTKRGIVNVWCQKEFRNLRDASEVKVRVPKPIKAVNNVLVMEFIGKNGDPARLLKDVEVENPEKVIKTLEKYIKNMWEKAKIVHGDLNEFNVLMLDSEVVLIDIGQAMSVKHPIALELLERDLGNTKRIAMRYGVDFDYAKILRDIVRR